MKRRILLRPVKGNLLHKNRWAFGFIQMHNYFLKYTIVLNAGIKIWREFCGKCRKYK